jgi:hypothetical protein
VTVQPLRVSLRGGFRSIAALGHQKCCTPGLYLRWSEGDDLLLDLSYLHLPSEAPLC